MAKRTSSIKTLRKRLWKITSEIVRRQSGGECFTCGARVHWKLLDCGHYVHKDCLDYDFTNLKAQCTRCNRYLHGNLGVYAEKLIALYGKDEIDDLRRRSHEVKKWTITELEEMLVKYKNILENIID